MFVKFLFDRLLALIILAPCLFLCLPCMIAIFLETRSNPILIQQRVGRGQNLFWLIKLRTMQIGTVHAGSHEVGAAAITKTGAVLRRLKLDELPQAINVLLGSMSFVGPRPCLPNQSELVAARTARGIFDVRPGITGLAQVQGIDMSTPDLLVRIDAKYIATRSFRGDLALMRQTVSGRSIGDAATK